MSDTGDNLGMSGVDDITAYIGSEIGRLAELEGQIELLDAEIENLHRGQEKMEEELALVREGMRRCVLYILWRESERRRERLARRERERQRGSGNRRAT
ncbi:hypothetical protein C8R43DRAFT_1137631 [Mycena crocata]|nr:hypothetical protein C8R43DRAFT_1137631 [Mycena crocata]